MGGCGKKTAVPDAARAGGEKPGRGAADVERLASCSLLAAVALVLSYLETMIPLPVALPGVKLGLANVAVAVALFTLDARAAAGVAAVKVLASGLLFGSPTMLAYSFGGTALAFAGMAGLAAIPGVGLVPVSMVAAILHNAGQLAVAALLLQTPTVFVNLPVLAVAACVTGGVTGAVGEAALASLERESEGGRGGAADGGAADGGAADGGAVAVRPVVDCSPLGRISPGERVAFIGANGSGKTSCALQLAGLAEADGGAAAATGGARAGVSFQDPDSQIVAPVVRDDVAFGPENRGLERPEMMRLVNDALVEAGIPELGSRDVDSLSGGEKQRVAVAGLLAMAPGLVVFDEATAMLDPAARASFDRLAARLCARGVAVVQVTQIMDEAFAADRVAVFRAGGIVFVGTSAEALSEPGLLESCGLGLPSTARLASALSDVGVRADCGSDLDGIEEAVCRWLAEA